MKGNTNRIFYFVLPISVLLCFFLWLLKTPPESVTVDEKNGIWDLRGVDFGKISAKLAGHPEYVLNTQLTPEGFAASNAVMTGAVPDGADFLTYRFRILLPEDSVVALARYASGNASRVYVNGRLLGEVGEPGATGETTVPSNRYMAFTAWPEDGVLEIVEQTSNFVHKDSFEPTVRFYVGNEGTIANWTTRFTAYPVIAIGVYALLFIVYLLLYLALPSYRANLWLALLCLGWALRTGVIGTKLWLSLLPWLTWEAAFRIEYLGFPVSLLLLALSYRELFPGALQKGFRGAVYIASALAAAFILLADTKWLSYTGVPMIVLGGIASIYVLVRILWMIRQPKTEQKIVLCGLGALLLALIADAIYFNTATTGSVPGSMMETALILFSLFQMTAMLHATMRETSAAKQAEQRLAVENAALDRVNRLSRDLMVNLAHEMRTPLAVMSAYAQVAVKDLRKTGVDPQTTEDLDTIQREAERLADMASGFLSMFREQESRQNRAPVDLRALLAQTGRLCAPMLSRKRNRLTLSIEEGLPRVLAGAGELTQVMLNLIANANRHTEGGEIAVNARLRAWDEAMVEVTVADNGAGIPPDLLRYVFERGATAGEGAGIGLSLCREIIASHGGAITIKSRLGEGTEVLITLPVIKGCEACD